ncbi:MAG: hypothetical protein R3A12_11375 [Ignavibacteria bacterium]
MNINIFSYNFLYQKNVLEKAVKGRSERLKQEIDRKLSEDPNSLIINSINSTYSNRLK